MKALNELKIWAKKLGWEYSHREGKHEIWVNVRTKNTLPMPSGQIRGKSRNYKNYQNRFVKGAIVD